MDKKRSKPQERNTRLHEACGSPGVPPGNTITIYVPATVSAVVIVTDKPVIRQREISLQ